ncbi:MAG: NAD(P)H-dependent oxidoreductase, partial [Bacteroidota bacterium]
MKVLHIDSSVRFERSISRQLSARMVQQLKAQFPNIVVDYLDLAKNPPAHPTELFTAAMYTPPAEQSPEMKAVLMASDELIDRMLRADLYV